MGWTAMADCGGGPIPAREQPNRGRSGAMEVRGEVERLEGTRRMAGAEGDGARVRSVPLDCSTLTRWRDERGSEIKLGD